MPLKQQNGAMCSLREEIKQLRSTGGGHREGSTPDLNSDGLSNDGALQDLRASNARLLKEKEQVRGVHGQQVLGTGTLHGVGQGKTGIRRMGRCGSWMCDEGVGGVDVCVACSVAAQLTPLCLLPCSFSFFAC
jgi:hypothetical protein